MTVRVRRGSERLAGWCALVVGIGRAVVPPAPLFEVGPPLGLALRLLGATAAKALAAAATTKGGAVAGLAAGGGRGGRGDGGGLGTRVAAAAELAADTALREQFDVLQLLCRECTHHIARWHALAPLHAADLVAPVPPDPASPSLPTNSFPS